MKYVVDIIYVLALAAFGPVMLYRSITQGRYKRGFWQRFGNISRRYPEKKCIWLHAVSLGEINAARSIITDLSKKFPGYEIAISTTTDTGFDRATELFGQEHTIFFFPFDFSWVMNKAFDSLNPSLCLLMELEVWYNFTHIAWGRNIPVVVLNARLSAKSFGRYKKIAGLIKPMFEKISLVLAQTEDYARRFIHLGVNSENVLVTGSLKYDTAQVTDKIEGSKALAAKLNLNPGPFWVAGGTGPDEERMILEVFRDLRNKGLRDLQLAIVPRKPERFDEVASLIETSGYTCIRYSRYKDIDAKAEPADNAVILGDTMGDLRKFYSIAYIIFVGRTLVPMGGSDMMEAAALGKCTLFGPHAYNFQQTVEALLAGNGALMVQDQAQLADVLAKCLRDDDLRNSIAKNGQNIIKANQGATARTMQALENILASA